MSSGSEEARIIKQRMNECNEASYLRQVASLLNEASQDQWRGIQSSTHSPITNHG